MGVYIGVVGILGAGESAGLQSSSSNKSHKI